MTQLRFFMVQESKRWLSVGEASRAVHGIG
jgi:hypothetical protein